MASPYYPTGDKLAQARACRAAGIEPARTKRHVETPKMVPGIVTVLCERCGCTYAKGLDDGQLGQCDYCGHKRAPQQATSIWDIGMGRNTTPLPDRG